MKPVLRKTLSVLVLALGLLYWVPLVENFHVLTAPKTTMGLWALYQDTDVFAYCYIALAVLLAGIFVPPPKKNRWLPLYISLALAGFVVTFWIQPRAAIMVLFLLPAFGVAAREPAWKAMIAITTAVALPMAFWWIVAAFVDGPPRETTSRVKADLRSMATAIEMYQIEHNSYPASTTTRPYGFWQSVEAMPSFAGGTGVAGLTTPVAYLTSYFEDPFRKLTDHRTFAYYCNGPMWIMISAGPDCRFDLPPDRLAPLLAAPHLPNDELFNYTYDPTNGAFSAGDIFRFKQ